MRTRDKANRMNSEGEQEKGRESRGWRDTSFLLHRFASEWHLRNAWLANLLAVLPAFLFEHLHFVNILLCHNQ